VLRQRPMDMRGASSRRDRRQKARHDAVAGMLDLAAAQCA
jgi:hypothetical protein